jgi:hypothetical protein
VRDRGMILMLLFTLDAGIRRLAEDKQ